MKKIFVIFFILIALTTNTVFASNSISANRGFPEYNPISMASFTGTLDKIGENGLLFVLDEKENRISYTVSDDTLIVGNTPLKENQEVFIYFEYEENITTYKAEIIIVKDTEDSIFIGEFDENLLEKDSLLKLNLSPNTILTDLSENEITKEELYNNKLIVYYTMTTRSIPPQTTPSKIILINPGDTEKTKKLDNELFSDWAIESIAESVEFGIIKDFELLKEPKKAITREEFAEIIMEVYYQLGGEKPENVSYFTDTNNQILAEANAVGIIKGIGNDLFAPERNITREEMAVIFERLMFELDILLPVTMQYIIFADEDIISDWASNSLQTMYKLNVIKGVGGNRIDPKGNTTIEQAIVMTHRFLKLTQSLIPHA